MKITLLTGKTYKIQEALGFDIKVMQASNAKRLTLRIDTKKRIPVLSLPKYCSQKKAIEFVRQHEDWIQRQLSNIPSQKEFKDGEKVVLAGKELTIKHVPEARAGVYIEADTLFVSGKKEFLRRRVIDFFKEYAKKEFTRKTKQKAKQIGCTVNAVVIKDTKSRWGSCSSNNNINYSWRIILAPIEVINYMVAHEVSHLKHQDHSANFWACVRSLEPKYNVGKNWLQAHGKDLYIY